MNYMEKVIFQLSDLSEQLNVGIDRLFTNGKITKALNSSVYYYLTIINLSRETYNDYAYNKISFEAASHVFDYLVFDLNNHYSKIKFLYQTVKNYQICQSLLVNLKRCISIVKDDFSIYKENQSFLSQEQLKMIKSVERAKYFISPQKIQKIKQLIERSSSYNQNTNNSSVSNIVLDSILDSVDPKIYELLNINKNYTGTDKNKITQPTKESNEDKSPPNFKSEEQGQNQVNYQEVDNDEDKGVFITDEEEDAESQYLQFLKNEENPLDQIF